MRALYELPTIHWEQLLRDVSAFLVPNPVLGAHLGCLRMARDSPEALPTLPTTGLVALPSLGKISESAISRPRLRSSDPL